MKKIAILASVVVVIGVCVFLEFYLRDRTAEIPDVTKPASLILKKKPSQEFIYALKLEVSGFISGSAEIDLIGHGEVFRIATVRGRVSGDSFGEWYSDEAEIRYTPVGVTNGSLTISYEFKD